MTLLVLLPLLAAFLLYRLPSEKSQFRLVGVTLLLLSSIAAALYFGGYVAAYTMPHWLEIFVVAADVALLLYFVWQGERFGRRLVTALALLQLFLYGWAEMALPENGGPHLVVDGLSTFMFLIINIVGGIIVLYAIRYMGYEPMPDKRKRLFIVYLLLFLSVMNAVVVTNSLLLFFFLFEMTTLASYLLIGFRGDERARENALKALWMNQVGGIVILLGTLCAIYGFGTVDLDVLTRSAGGSLLLCVALVSMAALVKGAQIPFDGWLLGAMVAPTPVSAILHSATMVKIAPWLVLKLSPALGGTAVGLLLSTIGGFVFVAASYLALSRSVFKEILGYSTIALLGLMIALAAIGTEETAVLAMVLIFFHALSKALLFMTAGVVEKLHHKKDIEEMKGLVAYAPKSARFILFGFVSLTLPPFGLFIVKLFAIESVTKMLPAHPLLLPLLLSILVGSTLLVLLYFKVTAAILSRPSDIDEPAEEKMPRGFLWPLALLVALVVVSTIYLAAVQRVADLSLFFLPILILVATPLAYRWMTRFDRVKPYHCGEKETFDAALYYYEPTAGVRAAIYTFFGFLFLMVALTGVMA